MAARPAGAADEVIEWTLFVAAIKGGKKPDDFLIDKSARKGWRKRRSKR